MRLSVSCHFYSFCNSLNLSLFSLPVGLTGPYSRIVKRRPLGTLAGIHVFSSILIQTGLMILGQLAMYYYLKSEPWYVPYTHTCTCCKFLLHFLIHIDVLMLCSKFELIPTLIFRVTVIFKNEPKSTKVPVL